MHKRAGQLARSFAVVLALPLLASLAGCGSRGEGEQALPPAVDTGPGKGRLMVRAAPTPLPDLAMTLRAEAPPEALDEVDIDDTPIALREDALREPRLGASTDDLAMRLRMDASMPEERSTTGV